jgi:RNA-binding protein
MAELSGRQRRALRARAHHLEPVVHVGRAGIGPDLLRSVDESLLAHELIKVRFVDLKEERRRLAGELAKKAGAQLVGLVGHIAVLYRPHPEPERRRIELPRGD